MKIKEFIVENISSVSINSICAYFGKTLNSLYNLSGKKKPDSFIREGRG